MKNVYVNKETGVVLVKDFRGRPVKFFLEKWNNVPASVKVYNQILEMKNGKKEVVFLDTSVLLN